LNLSFYIPGPLS